MSNLLARLAENAFWMARYIERVENLARILDVNETFARDSRGAQDWLPIIEINADDERFFARHEAAGAEAVIHFYVLDRDNPTSIISGLHMARENARGLRHLISTEMWTHLNVFYALMSELGPADLNPVGLSGLCATIKENCQTHTGIAEGTFHRDQGWYFYQIGKYLERADQSTRLLDIKYHRLLPSPEDVGTPVDVSQWNALLRSVAGYHAFRREHPRRFRPVDVAGFLLFNPEFPRSVLVCVRQVGDLLADLEARYRLADAPTTTESLDRLLATLHSTAIEEVMQNGLHEFLDRIQAKLIGVTDDMRRRYFGWNFDQQAQSAAG